MLRELTLIAVTVMIVVVGSFAICSPGRQEPKTVPQTAETDTQERIPYRRIVSLAPSITEILFALGQDEQLVGVTRYCDFPPEATTKTQVGGYFDPNYEAIIALEPDLVVMLKEHQDPKQQLMRLGYQVLVVDHNRIAGILESFETIGKTCGVEQEARSTVEEIKSRMEHIRSKTQGLPTRRVLVSMGRNMGSGSLKDVYVSGRNNFYDEMIELAGGVNAYSGEAAFPVISGEGVLRINPEVIIDMIPDLDQKDLKIPEILEEWQSVSLVDAVMNDRVHVFGEDYVVIPGPRFILILEKMARAIYPELNWEC